MTGTDMLNVIVGWLILTGVVLWMYALALFAGKRGAK